MTTHRTGLRTSTAARRQVSLASYLPAAHEKPLLRFQNAPQPGGTNDNWDGKSKQEKRIDCFSFQYVRNFEHTINKPMRGGSQKDCTQKSKCYH